MNSQHDGLTVWFGTHDAPAPFEAEVVPRQGVSLVVGAHPANPTNSIEVRFRVDGGFVQSLPGREVRIDYASKYQYFAVSFPRFETGELVEYAAVLRCCGRQVPPAHLAQRFQSFFRLEPNTLRRAAPGPA